MFCRLTKLDCRVLWLFIQGFLGTSLKYVRTFCLPITERGLLCGIFLGSRPLVLVRATWRWVWSVGGMILTGEDRSTGRKAYPSSNLFTTNPTLTCLESNPGHFGERPATDRLIHGTWNTIWCNKYVQTQFVPHSKCSLSRNLMFLEQQSLLWSSYWTRNCTAFAKWRAF